MMLRTAILLVIVFGAYQAASSEPELEDGVVVLEDDNFQDFVSKQSLLLLEFYAPWCGHCKKLAPEFAAAAKKLKGKVALAKVDATIHKKSAEKFAVRGYPTLVVLSDGGKVQQEYEGGRTADDIVSYLEKQLLPVVTEISVARELNDLVKSEKLIAVGFLLPESVSQAFEKVASSLRNDMRFGSVVDAAIAEAFEVKEPTIKLYKQYDEKEVSKPASDISLDDIKAFIQLNDLPLLDEIGPHNYRKYVSRGLPLAFVFIDPSQKKKSTTYETIGKEVAAKFRGKILFTTADGVKFSGHAKNLGLSGDSPFGFAIEDPEGRHFIYPEDEELTEEALTTLCTSVADGTAKPYLKSEPEPVDDQGPVVTLVGTNFQRIAIDSDKDVLIEFYAPWCGHCKSLAPIYEELATKLKDVKTMIIAKVDSTANDVPGFKIQSFPTIKFLPGGSKPNSIPFEGDRTVDGFISFLKEHATHKFDAPVSSTNETKIDEGDEEEEHDEL